MYYRFFNDELCFIGRRLYSMLIWNEKRRYFIVLDLIAETIEWLNIHNDIFDKTTHNDLLHIIGNVENLIESKMYYDVPAFLRMAKLKLEQFAISVAFSKRLLCCNDENQCGKLYTIPLEVREYISQLVIHT